MFTVTGIDDTVRHLYIMSRVKLDLTKTEIKKTTEVLCSYNVKVVNHWEDTRSDITQLPTRPPFLFFFQINFMPEVGGGGQYV